MPARLSSIADTGLEIEEITRLMAVKPRCGWLATHVRRKCGFFCVAKLANKRGVTFTAETIRVLRGFAPTLRHMRTMDNGAEFAPF